MLYLLRSDFRRDVNRQSFLSLLRICGNDTRNAFERTVAEAHTPYALAVAMRKLTVADKPLLAIGSYRQESLEATVKIIDTLRDEIKVLRGVPVILIARPSEWRNYDPVQKGPSGVELTHFIWDIKDGKMFVLPQAEGYGSQEAAALAAYLDHPKGSRESSKYRSVGTMEMFIDELPTGKMQKLPKGAMPDARRPPREDETQEQLIEPATSTTKTDASQHKAKTNPQQPGFHSEFLAKRASKPPGPA